MTDENEDVNELHQLTDGHTVAEQPARVVVSKNGTARLVMHLETGDTIETRSSPWNPRNDDTLFRRVVRRIERALGVVALPVLVAIFGYLAFERASYGVPHAESFGAGIIFVVCAFIALDLTSEAVGAFAEWYEQ